MNADVPTAQFWALFQTVLQTATQDHYALKNRSDGLILPLNEYEELCQDFDAGHDEE